MIWKMKITIQQQQDSSLFSVEWGEQRPLPPAHASVAPPETPRRLAVDNKCYLRRVSGGGLVQGWSNKGLDGLGRQAGFGWVAERRETGKGPEPGHRLARDRHFGLCGGEVSYIWTPAGASIA